MLGDLASKAQGMLSGGGGGDGAAGGDMVSKVTEMAKNFLASRKGASDDPEVAGDGTVEGDIAALKAAMKGIGTDEEKMINIIFRRPREHLQKLLEADRMLMTKMKLETSGKLQECIEYAFMTHAETRATGMYNGMKDRGTDEHCVIDCLCSCTPAEVAETREAYKRNGLVAKVINMDFRIKFETSGQLQRCFEAVLAPGRPESGVDEAHLAADVEVFHNATAGKLGTDERTISDLVAKSSHDHIRAINTAYEAKYGNKAFEVVRKECSGDVQLALMATMMPVEYWVAYRIHDAIKGFGTDEEALLRNVFIPKQSELRSAAIIMQEMYGENMVERVSKELSGALKDCIGTYLAYCITGQ